MDYILPCDKEDLVLQNLKLVYYVMNNVLNISQNDPNYEDIHSIGIIGLIKAACTFDLSKRISFSTYATQCIRNEILMFFRKAKKLNSNVSLDVELAMNDESMLGNSFIHPNSNFPEKVEQEDLFIYVLNNALNYLNGLERIAFICSISNKDQIQIGELMGISRSYVSRLNNKALSKVRRISKTNIRLQTKYKVKKGKGGYWISFTFPSINNFKNIISQVKQKLLSSIKKFYFDVKYKDEQISIFLPKGLDESYLFLGALLQELDKL